MPLAFDRYCSLGVDLPEYRDLAFTDDLCEAEPAAGATPSLFDDSLEFFIEANCGTDYRTLFEPASEEPEGWESTPS